MGDPQNGWFLIENPISRDDLGVSLFLKPSYLYAIRHGYIYPLRVRARAPPALSLWVLGARARGPNHAARLAYVHFIW